MTSEMVKNAWASMGYILPHIDPDIKIRTSLPEDFEKETIHGF